MNSSSAVNNILIAPAKAPTDASKRMVADDSRANDFQKTWQDVRAGQDTKTAAARKSQTNDKIAERAPVKRDDVVAADRARDIKKPDDSRKTTETKKADNAQKTDADKSVKEEPSSAKNETDKTVEASDSRPSTDEKTAKDGEQTATAVDQQTVAVVDPAAVNPAILASTESTSTEGESLTATLEGGTDSVVSDVTPAEVQTKSGSSVGDVALAAQLGATSIASSTPTTSDGAAEAPVAAAALAKTPSVATLPADINAETPELLGAATEMLGDAKSSLTKNADTATVAVAPTATAATTEASAPATDAKSTFEKMLQTMASNAGGEQSRDPNSQAANQQPTPTSPAESLLRTFDSQAPAARGFVVQTAVPVNVGQPQWSQAIGDKILWLAAQNVTSAEIRLDPLDLGPMQVKVSVNQDQATVNFTSHHPVVREALDQNLGRLREMFAEQGLSLNVDVSDKSFSRQQGEGKAQHGQGGSGNAVAEEEQVAAVSTIMQQRLVDHYA